METPTLEQIRKAMTQKGYAIFSNGAYNINIVGIRAADPTVDIFNDWLTVFYKDESEEWKFHAYEATTDPGAYYLQNPMRDIGTAILAPGQHRLKFEIGLHKNRYKALVQKGPLPLYRDNNKNAIIDFDSNLILNQMAGINIHSTNKKGIPPFRINRYSAGCQVIRKRNSDFKEFMELCDLSSDIYGPRLSYTLLLEEELYLVSDRKLQFSRESARNTTS